MPCLKTLTAAPALLAGLTFTHAGTLDVFTCRNGELTTVKVSLTGEESLRLIRSGSAIWSSGRWDRDTFHAMVERRGIWDSTPATRLFEVLGTKTPASYLAAIAAVESGRNGYPWPWTINFNGKGHFFTSMERAVDAARNLVRSGYTSFDVGAMQVNWHFHGHMFDSIESAFDPVQNIRVADQLIQAHHRSTGSWAEALGRYHSKTPSLKHNYLQKVNQHLCRISQPNPNTRKQPC